MKKNDILLIGGAGYIGTVITNYFLRKNFKITCLDNLIYNQSKSIKKFKNKRNYKFIFGDLRDKKLIKKVIKNHTNIIILAGLVGDPITKKYPKISESINYFGIKNLIIQCKKINSIEKLIFVSTCSNYGIGKGRRLLDENSPLKPLSLYSKHKVKIEKFILNLKSIHFSTTILRFATAFGISPRMRFDLTINHFTKSFADKEELKIFDPKTSRPYCHVLDFARSIERVLAANQKKINRQVFNIGSNQNNYTKEKIIKRISKYIPKTKIIFLKNDIDKRDYRVNFKKVKAVLNFQTKYNVDFGIKEIKKFLKTKRNRSNINNFGNYIIK
tara:strand:+ start:7443 stop:8429 length:987 start_codon:yes stop_codon:yes gene_type:complete